MLRFDALIPLISTFRRAYLKVKLCSFSLGAQTAPSGAHTRRHRPTRQHDYITPSPSPALSVTSHDQTQHHHLSHHPLVHPTILLLCVAQQSHLLALLCFTTLVPYFTVCALTNDLFPPHCGGNAK